LDRSIDRQPRSDFGSRHREVDARRPNHRGATLSRFFALHVFVVPGSLIAFVCLHLLMVLKLGINEWPMPGAL
jgi:hypothetical protein